MMEYKKFSEFADEPPLLDGAKINIVDILNKEILVIGYRLADSKYKKDNNSQCLTLQIELDEKRYVVFSGSRVLINQIEKYKAEIPFLTTIKKIDKYFSFT